MLTNMQNKLDLSKQRGIFFKGKASGKMKQQAEAIFDEISFMERENAHDRRTSVASSSKPQSKELKPPQEYKKNNVPSKVIPKDLFADLKLFAPVAQIIGCTLTADQVAIFEAPSTPIIHQYPINTIN